MLAQIFDCLLLSARLFKFYFPTRHDQVQTATEGENGKNELVVCEAMENGMNGRC
jgi:hypothetical protein